MLHTIATQKITTHRLNIYCIDPAGTKALLEKQTEEEACSTFGFDTVSQIRRFREISFTDNAYRSYMLFLVHDKASNFFVGNISYHTWMKEHARGEIGYIIHPSYRNKGMAKEALKEIYNYGFETMQLNRIEACIGLTNEPSLKLAAYFGFVKEGLLREHYCKNGVIEDSLIFSLLHREYEQIKNNW